MVSGYDEFIDKYEVDFPERYKAIKIDVMVLGPSINRSTPGAKLRKFIIKQCREHITAIKGEHVKLIEAFRRTAGSNHSLCSMELDVAKNEVDAIIIIPASPGSFVELGLFALLDDICQKTLVLFSDKYTPDADNPTFIELGPKVAYESRKAKVDFVDYRDKESVWELVNAFLLGYRALKFDKKLLESS